MVQVPENEVTAEDFAEWYRLKGELAAVKAKEMLLRTKIANAIFPMRVEGTNSHDLADGWVLKCKHVITRDIDEAALNILGNEMVSKGIPVANLLKYKPSLVLSEYRKLTEEQRQEFDQVLISKPGTPALDVMLPAKNKKE